MMVVSEIGEQWSPHTAPAIQAEIEIIKNDSLCPLKALTIIGMRMPKIPQDVPVAKAKRAAIRKINAGKIFMTFVDKDTMIDDTKPDNPKPSVIAFKVHANTKIKIDGTIDVIPSGSVLEISL